MRTLFLGALAIAGCADISPHLPGGGGGDGDGDIRGDEPGGGGGGDDSDQPGGGTDDVGPAPDGGSPGDPVGATDAGAIPIPPTVTVDTFQDGTADGWAQYGGTASVAGGAYRLANAADTGKSAWYRPSDDLTLEADIRVASGDGDAGLFLRATNISTGIDTLDGYYVALNDNSDRVLIGTMDGTWTQLTDAPVTIDEGIWYHVKIEMVGTSIAVYVTDMDTPKIELDDDQWSTGSVGVRTFYTDSSFDNVKVIE
jgi:hypothetical protein